MRYATHKATIAWLRMEQPNMDLAVMPNGTMVDELGNRYNAETGRCGNNQLWPVIVLPTLRPIARKLELVK